ncbi:universal stress protein A-like protein [Actinia tenebrosa]|uniref:Universal stress protein A-like protein n=1 Tax=Actinia tenebrosa TaxID=6105 RepID=A0A6P8ITR2_ACTTE|nr:universal stress protein A-like protein [Actinia tenebrosa]
MSSKKKVVIPVDGSEHSEKAFEWYRNHIHEKDDELLVLHVQEPPTVPSSPYPYGGTVLPDEWNKAVDQTIADAAKIIDYYGKKCQQQGLKCKLYKGSGKAGESICQLAEDQEANQILMGSRGCGKVRRTLMGSVSDYCVHHSNVPVTVIPPVKTD